MRLESLSISFGIHYLLEFIFTWNSWWLEVYFKSHFITWNSLSFRINHLYRIIICYSLSLEIHYQFHDITWNWLSFRIHYPSLSCYHFLFIIAWNLLSILLYHLEFTIVRHSLSCYTYEFVVTCSPLSITYIATDSPSVWIQFKYHYTFIS